MKETVFNLLACPKSGEALHLVKERDLLYAPTARLAYRIEAGIPQLLPEQALPVDDALAQALDALLEAS